MGDDSWAASWHNRRLILKTGIGECNALNTATVICYCLPNKRFFT